MSNADERIRENMKSYNHLYENCISEENRRISLNLAKHSKRMRRIMKSRHLSDDALVALSYDWINNYENAEHVPVYIYDGITRKERVIIVPTMEELIVQHNVVNALKPMFCKGMYEHSYASLPGRGAHKGKQVIEKWIRTDAKNCKYVLKMDIRHFFDTVPHDKLKAKLRKTIHDEKMLDLLFRIIDVTDVGIPLGFYTSQWLSNWYLQGLDHYIKERLGAVHYMRYMDDMVIFGSNKKVLHRTRQAISDYLENELGLSLKDNWQVFRFSYGKTRGATLTSWDSDSSGTELYFVKPSCTRPRKKPENFPEKRNQRYTTPVRCCHISAGLTAPILTRCIGNGLNHISALSN